jgi:hypothetical protein
MEPDHYCHWDCLCKRGNARAQRRGQLIVTDRWISCSLNGAHTPKKQQQQEGQAVFLFPRVYAFLGPKLGLLSRQ